MYSNFLFISMKFDNGFSHTLTCSISIAWGDNNQGWSVAADVSDALNYTEDLEARRKIWSEIARKWDIDESEVEITDCIRIKWVCDLELHDVRWDHQWSENNGAPNLEEGKAFILFLNSLGNEQERFLVEVVQMTCSPYDRAYYWTSSLTDEKTHKACSFWISWWLRAGECSFSIQSRLMLRRKK